MMTNDGDDDDNKNVNYVLIRLTVNFFNINASN